MKVLVCGARGFIGAALCERLERAGHHVLRGVRRIEAGDDVEIDYTRDVAPAQWDALLSDVDAVINAVGILIEDRRQTFERVHTRGPIALFDACQRCGVGRVIQISALGAQSGTTAYFRSKRAADDHLQSLSVDAYVVRPALVYGISGASASFFRSLASLPLHVLPGGGHQRLRPVHVDELAEIVERLLRGAHVDEKVVEIVGGEDVAYREMLSIYRTSLGFGPACRVSMPGWAIGLGAALLDRVPGSMLTRDTWHMLQSGSTGDPAQTQAILQRSPAGLRTFIGADASMLRDRALGAWRSPLLRGVLAVIWLWTVVSSVFLYPRADSLAMLARSHLHGGYASASFWLATGIDLVFGVMTIVRPGRRLWLAQAVVIVAYSSIIAVTMPEMLWHPFGPVLKNLPILAILLMLFSEDTAP
ncbi:SDR family oxidoreductase [Pandoraea sp. ISTKB]|uniref:SDR family oxidoreductase n=1 Tax=Pandoraea sp. ISTKB TaxID=1586708 RepID=UPI000846F068|nr:SDR family oxidoreductase [Pandoraea sp. ISTKB]ODP32997.1 NAD-dependent dehydratase [Pandoraea sp. ISTKB]